MQSTIKELYNRIRKNGMSASRAYTEAKNRLAAGVQWYNIPVRGMIEYNQASDNGLRWVENAASGLRFVNFADKLGARGIQHTGWFTDDDGAGGTLRGVVYRLPARDGKEQFVPGYIESENHNDTGGACLDFSDIHHYELDAAYAADKLAERTAENEREYNEAWRAGSDYSQELQGIKETRRACLELISAIKKERARGAAPIICNALREQVKGHLRVISKAKKHAAQLWDDYEHLRNPNNLWRRHLWVAFADGAGIAA